MRIATWNLNNRVGKVRFRLEAAHAAIALDADVLVFTEFFPQQFESRFRTTLDNAGWSQQIMSAQPKEVANRILVASKLPLAPLSIDLPTFDQQFPANLLGVRFPSLGISVLSVRVPAYSGKSAHLLSHAWEWLEVTAASLSSSPSVVIGDLNVSMSQPSRAGNHFRRIVASGWQRAAREGANTFFGHRGKKTEIDHVLATSHCILSEATCVQEIGGFVLAGTSNAISDHAALTCHVELSRPVFK